MVPVKLPPYWLSQANGSLLQSQKVRSFAGLRQTSNASEPPLNIEWAPPRQNKGIDKRGLCIDRESNRVPPGYETDALTIELY